MVDAPLIGESASHRALLASVGRIAPTDVEVLITGPTGVGKELYARLIHSLSRRCEGPFVAVNCGALPNELFENELFGHVGGAFTGAQAHHEGLVPSADSGTLFLDEIDGLTLPSQVKLLRLIQEKEYRRLGESRTRQANIRIVAATNADLRQLIAERQFREDLFFRLRVVPIDVPPLRRRSDDIMPICTSYAAHYADVYQLPRVSFTPVAQQRMLNYAWPGNVRELENCVRYLTCLQLGRPVEPEDLPLLEAGKPAASATSPTERPLREAKRELIGQFESTYLTCALRESNGNIARAARLSQVHRRAFFELMRKYGIKALSSDPKTRKIDELDSCDSTGLQVAANAARYK